MNLKDFLDQNPDLTLGADGTEAVEALQGIGIVSDALEELISAKAGLQGGANTPLRDVVGEWLMQDDPEAAQELGLAPQAPAPEQDPAMAQPAPAPEEVPAEEPAMAEDPNKSQIPASMRKAKGGDWKVSRQDLEKEREKNISDPKTLAKNSGRSADEDHIEPGDDKDKLIEKGTNEEIWQAVEGFLDKEKGTWTKGRPGIVAHCSREFGEEGGKKAAKAIMILSKKYPMRDEPEDEGWKGTLAGSALGGMAGTVAGGAVGGPIGSLAGGVAGQVLGGKVGDVLGGKDEEEKESVMKMSNESFADIMRLAGLTKQK